MSTPDPRRWVSSSGCPVEKYELSTWHMKIHFSLSVKGGKREFKCCVHSLKSAITFINISSERWMHLLPTKHKITNSSDYVLTLLYFSAQPHCCETLCPASHVSGFTVSLTAIPIPIPLCLKLTAGGEAHAKGRWAPKTKGELSG